MLIAGAGLYRSCPMCKQFYTGKMVIDLAYKFMDHTEDMPATYTLRITAIFNLAQRYLDAAPGAPDAAEKAEKAMQVESKTVGLANLPTEKLAMRDF